METLSLDRTDDIIRELQKINGKDFSEEQLDILRYKRGMSLIAVAGSGKTSTLINLVVKRIWNGEIQNVDKLLCCTYSKGGADELSTRLNKLLRKCGLGTNVTVKTLHAAYAQILRVFGVRCGTDNIVTEGERRGLIREVSREVGLKLDDDGVEALDNMISVQVNELLSDDDVMTSSKFTLDISKSEYSAVRQGYAEKKTAMGKMDFDDMQLYVHNWLCVSNIEQVKQYCWNTWEYFYIDEFQDTNKIQFEILQVMLRDKDKLIVIGDDDQSIYSWRGADPNIILNICGYYDIKKFTLPTNYRCGSTIVDYASCCVDKMSHRENKSMKAYRNGGSVEILDVSEAMGKASYKNELAIMSEAVVNKIEEKLNDTTDITMPKDICVMSRNNANLCLVNNMLLKRGIFSEMANSIKLSNNAFYKDIKKVIKLDGSSFSRVDINTVIWKLIPYSGMKCARMISDIMDEAACGLKEALKLLVNAQDRNRFGATASIDENDGTVNVKVSDRTRAKIEYEMSNYRQEVRTDMRSLYFAINETNSLKRIKTLLYMYKNGVSFMCKAPDQARLLAGIVEYIAKLYDEKGVDGANQFLRMSEQYETGKFAVTDGKIALTTIHSAKGKEWKTVFIMADDNFTFPSYYGIQKMIDRKVKEYDILEYIDSERRLHYVAQTRAKEELYFVCDINKASRFILEAYDVVKKNTSAYGANNISILNRAEDDSYNDVAETNELRKVAKIIEAQNELVNNQKDTINKCNDNVSAFR